MSAVKFGGAVTAAAISDLRLRQLKSQNTIDRPGGGGFRRISSGDGT